MGRGMRSYSLPSDFQREIKGGKLSVLTAIVMGIPPISCAGSRRALIMDRFYDEEEILALRFASVGKNVRIDRSTILVDSQGISVGDN
jgi:hypothetical protein